MMVDLETAHIAINLFVRNQVSPISASVGKSLIGIEMLKEEYGVIDK